MTFFGYCLLATIATIVATSFLNHNIASPYIRVFFALIVVGCITYAVLWPGKILKKIQNYHWKYIECPCCEKMIKTEYNWQCEHCHEYQIEANNILNNCNKCKKRLKTFICPFCNEEFGV